MEELVENIVIGIYQIDKKVEKEEDSLLYKLEKYKKDVSIGKIYWRYTTKVSSSKRRREILRKLRGNFLSKWQESLDKRRELLIEEVMQTPMSEETRDELLTKLGVEITNG